MDNNGVEKDSGFENGGDMVIRAREYLKHLTDTCNIVFYRCRFDPNVEPEKGMKLLFVSENIEDLVGCTAGECLENPGWWGEFIHPEDIGVFFDETKRRILKEDRIRQEYRLKCKGGGYLGVLDEKTVVRDKSGRPSELLGSWRGVAEHKLAVEKAGDKESSVQRKNQEFASKLKSLKGKLEKEADQRSRVEELLQESKDRFHSLFERLPVGVFRSTPNGRFLEANPYHVRLLGCPDLETLWKTPVASFYGYPEQRTNWKRLTERSEGTFSMEVQWKKLDGTPIWVRETAKAVRDENGNVLYYEGVAEDITRIKKAEEERKKMETRLQESQRMESIGTLAGGIAHDFNNLLMGILGNASLMLLDFDPSDPHYAKLQNIEKYARNGAELTRQLLGFARKGKYEVKPADLNELARRTLKMFARTRKEIAVHTKYESNLRTVEVDEGQIQQVLVNLFLNAWQAMPGGGEIYLETENVNLDKSEARALDIEEGKYVKVSVKDQGVGIDKEDLKRIFDPFFTTREMKRGTGLGLASAYGIIKNHGGNIDVYSKKGEGSAFSIFLPAAERSGEKQSRTSKRILRGNETLLLVDDEQMIIDVGNRMLRELGYEVLTAGSGAQALDVYNKYGDRVNAVILDMIMPGMGGGETYDRLKEANPDIKVILSSGYSMDAQAKDIMERGCNGFIQKPFDLEDISFKLREVLDE